MPTTRSSARKVGTASPESSKSSAAGSKRKADSSPSASPAAKVKKSPASKKQKTIEETLPIDNHEQNGEDASKDVEMKDTTTNDQNTVKDLPENNETGKDNTKATDSTVTDEASDKVTQADQNGIQAQASNGNSTQQSKNNADDKPETDDAPNTSTGDASTKSNTESSSESAQLKNGTESSTDKADTSSQKTNGLAQSTAKEPAKEENGSNATDTNPTQDTAVSQSSQREQSTPSSILEKGIIYFFFRGRVGIDEPTEVNDLARSYIVLHPLPRGAKLSDGPLGDSKNLRVLALPKKVLPKGPQDRFMVFVEKSKANLEDLKKEFLSSSDYDTKTAGTRHTPAATPIGEGVYAITSTGRESHLAYVLTIPQDLSEVQKDIGLEAKGSWVASVKNPQHKGPAQAQLPNDPEFPKEILDEFRTLRWGPLQPKHLDYENCQFLLIGHKDHSFAKATETDDKEADPKEELEKLGEEDERRVEHLEGNDTVFEDLNIDAKEYPSVQTTWQ